MIKDPKPSFDISRYNPFPAQIWAVFFMIFVAGYFIGGAVMSLSEELKANYTRKINESLHIPTHGQE